MIAHIHGDVKYAHYGLDFYPDDANYTVGSFAKFLRDLEKSSAHSSRVFFMVVERHSFMRQCYKGMRFVCCHCRNQLEIRLLENY